MKYLREMSNRNYQGYAIFFDTLLSKLAYNTNYFIKLYYNDGLMEYFTNEWGLHLMTKFINVI